MHRVRVSIVIAILALVAGSAAPAGAASGSKPVASNGGRPVSAAAQARAVRYWTTARMRAAREVPAPAIKRGRPVNGLADETNRRPMLVEGSTQGDASIPAVDPTVDEYAYPFPYTRYGVESPLYTVAPYRAIGKIFFRSGGTNYVCSGASVVGGTRHVVFTAGHCLYEGGWSSRVVFVPAYRNGVRPYGTFPARNLAVLNGWKDQQDYSYDMGAFDVGKNSSGKTLRSRVGSLGFAANLPRTTHWNSFGWPAGAPFNGETLQVCQASHATDDLTTGMYGGPVTQGIGCDMTGGSSGGPWIFRLRRGNYLNSVNSYGYNTQPEAMYGPYFGDAANVLRCFVGTEGTSTTC